jgi:hypothetical protein
MDASNRTAFFQEVFLQTNVSPTTRGINSSRYVSEEKTTGNPSLHDKLWLIMR